MLLRVARVALVVCALLSVVTARIDEENQLTLSANDEWLHITSSIECSDFIDCMGCLASKSSLLGSKCQWCPGGADGLGKCVSKASNEAQTVLNKALPDQLDMTSDVCPVALTTDLAKCPFKLGPNGKPKQPDLDAKNWLLTCDEINEARDGAPRNQPIKKGGRVLFPALQCSTSKNDIQLLTTGNQVFKHFHDDALKAKQGDFIFHTGWIFGPKELPLLKNDPESTIGNVISKAVKSGVLTQMLLWKNIMHQMMDGGEKYMKDVEKTAIDGTQKQKQAELKTAMAQLKQQKKVEKSRNTAGDTEDDVKRITELQSMLKQTANSRILLDARNNIANSMHQKYSVIKHDGVLSSLIGGVDLAYARWDEPAHNNPPERKAFLPSDKKHPLAALTGWVDRHLYMTGDISKDIAATFIQRWNNPNRLTVVPDDDSKAPEPDSEDLIKLPDTSKEAMRKGTMHAQLLRTYSCGYALGGVDKFTYPFAPNGETSVFNAIIKAILHARYYIYMEDQYALHVPLLNQALQAVLPRINHLVVVFPPAADTEMGKMGCASSQYVQLMTLKTAYPAKVTLLKMKDKNMYVHSKTFLIDDVYFLTGSANSNHRSYASDSEADVAVVDSETVKNSDHLTVTKFAHDARLKIFAEVAKVPVEDMAKLRMHEAVSALMAKDAMTQEYTIEDEGVTRKKACDASDPDDQCEDHKKKNTARLQEWINAERRRILAPEETVTGEAPVQKTKGQSLPESGYKINLPSVAKQQVAQAAAEAVAQAAANVKPQTQAKQQAAAKN